VVGEVTEARDQDLPEGDVLIEVHWSSVNYKDALAAKGHPGVAPLLPHIPGIDAAGRVIASSSSRVLVDQSVLVTGYDLGGKRWGGWSQRIRVPADWVVPVPTELSEREAMVYGTAGLTAAQCVLRLLDAHVTPECGPIVVTGATGGVGCLAVMLLHRLGYEVVASSGKTEAVDWLRDLGATEVIDRDEVRNAMDKPLATPKWAGAIDTVGGQTLASLLRSTRINGCVAACGMVGGTDLPMTVYPFILRGTVLAGVTSQNCPHNLRTEIWSNLAGSWRLPALERITTIVKLADLSHVVEQTLAGKLQGRAIVSLDESP
jgi:acrylyl-CoA reductase (NADPH)